MRPPAGSPAGIVKRSLSIAGHRTSVSLEPEFWSVLAELAAARGQSVAGYVAAIDAARTIANLSSAIRIHVLNAARSTAATTPPRQ